jgi:hypothetical protein
VLLPRSDHPTGDGGEAFLTTFRPPGFTPELFEKRCQAFRPHSAHPAEIGRTSPPFKALLDKFSKKSAAWRQGFVAAKGHMVVSRGGVKGLLAVRQPVVFKQGLTCLR